MSGERIHVVRIDGREFRVRRARYGRIGSPCFKCHARKICYDTDKLTGKSICCKGVLRSDEYLERLEKKDDAEGHGSKKGKAQG